MKRLWILGASDPEMEQIESVLRERGELVRYAMIGGRRVRPETAYRAAEVRPSGERADWWSVTHIMCVECDTWGGPATAHVKYIDHHRPGDQGYGRPAAEYMSASSLGQVLAALGIEPSSGHRLAAAADHCLAAAYRGECPGVDPDALMEWRVRTRAAHQRRTPEALLSDIERAKEILDSAPLLRWSTVFGGNDPEDWDNDPVLALAIADLRGQFVAELPEAAARDDRAYVATPLALPGERQKVVLGAASREQAEWFLAAFPAADKYGDPERGFAGGYI
jgi:hypothetical protein